MVYVNGVSSEKHVASVSRHPGTGTRVSRVKVPECVFFCPSPVFTPRRGAGVLRRRVSFRRYSRGRSEKEMPSKETRRQKSATDVLKPHDAAVSYATRLTPSALRPDVCSVEQKNETHVGGVANNNNNVDDDAVDDGGGGGREQSARLLAGPSMTERDLGGLKSLNEDQNTESTAFNHVAT